MATGSGGSGGKGNTLNPNVTDLLQKLKLTEEEDAVLDFSDAEEEETLAPVEFALYGKILSPVPVHVSTVRSAMKPAWGNPVGLKLRAIGEKKDNLFVAEFGSQRDMERILAGAPWMVGKYSILLQEYDGKLTATDVKFERVELWARLLNLPIGWMNRARGSRAMDMIGKVIQMDVDRDGKASGAFLRARVAIQIDKPVRRGIRLRVNKNEEPRWFQIQYERLPYICFHCGFMGHSDLECETPAERGEDGKLPYDVNLRAPEEKKKKLQSFAAAAAASYGSGSSSGFKQTSSNRSGARGSRHANSSRHSESQVGDSEELEIESPIKHTEQGAHADTSGVSRNLFQAMDEDQRLAPRKRKSKPSSRGVHTPDLNIPIEGGSNAIVPIGLVNSRVSQLDGAGDSSGNSMIEQLKKQKRGEPNDARSAAAASGSPRRAQ
ncbi:uncharacterized protein LOC101786648 [Setaria italica]|uniref:uncharacterized protein LOC101785285 n=1 Tax=Setaria italica TaxID=4555 RepID=UPI00064550B0|nr:uncharacterized protein LOC101785285 [Setaria italica]XP_012702360.1 uncharacterized protein LOC101786648 [Setaria italica]